ncbi:MAG: YciI family protein [Gammaproteobacteria bacterium]|nr:YciI family protein [Gammaproteobacteria bacterium]MCH9744170.1 YciI family protein [Gammaproteobacteria bacterium]
MYYVIYCEDADDSFERRKSVRDAHLERLELLKQEDRLLIAGPIMAGDSEDMLEVGVKGSMIVAEFETIDAAKAWAAADPYVTANVYARISVDPFKKVLP